MNFCRELSFLPRLEAEGQYVTQSFESLDLYLCPRQLCSFFLHTPSITNGPPPPSHFLHSPSLGFHSEKVTPKRIFNINLTITESYKTRVLLHHGQTSRGQSKGIFSILAQVIIEIHALWLVKNCHLSRYLRIFSCLACVYRIMDAREKFGEHEKCVRVARGAAQSNSSFLMLFRVMCAML